MRIVEAGFEILNPPDPTDRIEVLKFIERIGRVCYKSEDAITDTSCISFIQKLRNRKHWAMLEHYFFAMSVPEYIFDALLNPQWYDIDNCAEVAMAMRFINRTRWQASPSERYKYIISGSATAFNNLWQTKVFQKARYLGDPSMCEEVIVQLCHFLEDQLPELMFNPSPGIVSEIDKDIKFLSSEEIRLLPISLRLIHDWMSIHFITDRGVSHELVRHRPCSWAQESTRFCDYGKEKFGRGINVLNPVFFEKDSEEYKIWYNSCKNSEEAYLRLTEPVPTEEEPGNTGEFGRQAQEARSILPNSTKTEIVMTGILHELHHFFKMRLPKSAHPQMRQLTIPLFKSLPGNYKEVFTDLESWIEEGVS